ncbi:translation initiation factor IF-2 subunit beta [Halovenus rubra]|uniref:Translation initiation factor IF-2 subunit beta n=2 Tax=Halovenus rubra TaxID=869890 RepID=A0ABD5X0I9_9EURY|nr:translation initiation factor IF-2 subunit beta [Halovenus rubra]
MEYDDMLDRGLEETPDIEGNSDRFSLPEPEVRQEGHATVFENFQGACRDLDRDEDHLLKFLQDELGTSAHIDESGRGRFTGEFSERRIRNALETYAERFVLCSECELPDTSIVEEQGAELLQCAACGARSPTSG